MCNSTELITCSDIVRDMSAARMLFIAGEISYDAFVGFHLDILSEIEEARLMVQSRNPQEVLCGEVYEDLDNQETYVSSRLTAIRAHRNSTCFQGGDFDLYLSCQNPGGNLPQPSGWGVL